jgi:hypothetical protein
MAVKWRAVSELRPHAHAQLPPLDDAEQGALQTDIEKRGILEPLEITSDGIVLDGRERLRAAGRCGILARWLKRSARIGHALEELLENEFPASLEIDASSPDVLVEVHFSFPVQGLESRALHFDPVCNCASIGRKRVYHCFIGEVFAGHRVLRGGDPIRVGLLNAST